MSFHPTAMRRLTAGPLASSLEDGNNGAFTLPSPEPGWVLFAVASDGMGWDHVSISARQGRRTRTPTWREMVAAKDACWDPDDVVIQYHPRRADYVNNHPHVLHLWRSQVREFPTPDPMLVGDPTRGVLDAALVAVDLRLDLRP